MPRRNSCRCRMMKAEPLTARMPMGVETPMTRKTRSWTRRRRAWARDIPTKGYAPPISHRGEACLALSLCGRQPTRSVAAAAAAGCPGVLAGVEGVPARARLHRVRVVDGEPSPHEAVHVVDLRSAQVGCAEVVDPDPDPLLLHALTGPPHLSLERH